MKKVLLMGLSDFDNIGDQFVSKCVQYLVVNSNNQVWEEELVSLIPDPLSFRYLIYGGLRVIAHLLPHGSLSFQLDYIANVIRERRYYKKIISTADAIILSVGSYKYTTQNLWAYYLLVIQIAEAMRIPVMFNAMNIQDYDEKDWRCRMLKKYTNYSCVKVFTTRDGIAGITELEKYYITNPNIKISTVGDPAYWIPECYDIRRNPGSVIGINLIRGHIFVDYGKSTTKEQLLHFYADLITKLDSLHIKWELFTNGGCHDLRFGRELLEKMGRKDVRIRVPKSDSELPRIIAGYKGIIGARLHACICAYSLDTPMAGFIWDKKLLRFAQTAKLEDHFLDEKDLDAAKMIACLHNALQSAYDERLRTSLKTAAKQAISDFLQTIETGDKVIEK